MSNCLKVFGEVRLSRVYAARWLNFAAVGELPVCCLQRRLEFCQPPHKEMHVFPQNACLRLLRALTDLFTKGVAAFPQEETKRYNIILRDCRCIPAC